MQSHSKSKVAYCYDENIGNYHYGPGHPMKPLRVKMCHNLVMNYDLFRHMNIINHKPADKERLTQYHSEDYINFLEKVNPRNMSNFRKELTNFNVGEDCPVFEGIYDYNSLAAGGTIEAVAQLNHQRADIAINWSGGLHHAKRCEASGFCYVNDIVLGILELLRYHPKVLYIDIDVHHGDGVEEAFFATDRVMTLSFHKFGEFFPGTGDLRDIGYGEGKYYSINVPLRAGIDDETFKNIFEPVTKHCIEWYNPSVIVLQCGADSLAGDRLGCFNLSATGHSQCVQFVKSLNIPMLVLGGGGYTVRNVAKCWTKETGVLLGKSLDNKLPLNDYFDFYGPEYQLEVDPLSLENLNTPAYIQSVTEKVINNIKRSQTNPNVQLQEMPGDLVDRMDIDDDNDNPDIRINSRLANSMIAHDNEFYGGRFDTNERDYSNYQRDGTPGNQADSDDTSQASNTRSDVPPERQFVRRPTLELSRQWDSFHHAPSALAAVDTPDQDHTPNPQSPIFHIPSPQENGNSHHNRDGSEDNLKSPITGTSPKEANQTRSSQRGSQSPTTHATVEWAQDGHIVPAGASFENFHANGHKNVNWDEIDRELDWSMSDDEHAATDDQPPKDANDGLTKSEDATE